MEINNKAKAALTSAALVVAGGTAYINQKVYDIQEVIDGDTIRISMYRIPKHLQKMSVRVMGVDTPEKSWRAECEKERLLAEEASAFTNGQVAQAKHIDINFVKWDKYGGRVLGDVILDGKSLTKMLIDNGYAREYYGEKKESWCL